MENNNILIERDFDASVELLWEALTNNERLKEWYFDFKGNFKAEVGHVFEWEAGHPEGKQWLHQGKILEVIENKKLVHTWLFPGYSGLAKLTWELEKVNAEKTHLKMDFEFIELFDSNEEELHRSNFEAGWNAILNSLLVEYIKKQ